MKERVQGKDLTTRIDEREKKLRQLTAEYLRGEIPLEEYHEGCRNNISPINFRRIAAWQDQQTRVRKIESQKRKIKNFARKLFKHSQNS